jgi:colanic acid/amylovoran biosynthesis glycosyltransferase
VRIGYLVPQFPGQTHVMFWRELAELEALGVEADIVSTRPPTPRVQSHSWAEDARARTTYLFPPSPSLAFAALTRLALAGAGAWRAAVRAIVRSQRPARGRLPLLVALLLGAELAEVARRRRWRHVHVHSCAFAADIARFARLLGGPTYSISLHGPLRDYGPDQRAKWSGAAFAIVVSNRLLEQVRSELAGSLPSEVRVMGMGVAPERLARPGEYAPWTGEGTARIFSCGRLNPAKGHLDLLAAVHALRDRGLRVELAIAGEDEAAGKGYRSVVERQIDRLGLGGVVRLLGAVGEEVVVGSLHEAHVFALASLGDPFPVAIMEAMAAGTPVVATAAGGVPELLQDGREGLLVPPAASGALADALERVLRDPALATSLSTAAAGAIAGRAAAGSSARMLASLLGQPEDESLSVAR